MALYRQSSCVSINEYYLKKLQLTAFFLGFQHTCLCLYCTASATHSKSSDKPISLLGWEYQNYMIDKYSNLFFFF